MEKRLVLRGVLAGALAGLLAFVFARIFIEPQIQAAIDYESGRDAAQAVLDKAAGLPTESAGPDIFSWTIQANLGIGVGMMFFGMAMGALFTVVYTICMGRVGALGPRTLALLVAAGGFLGVYLVPFIKYPANPPSIGHPNTITDRGGLYVVMVHRFYSLAAQLILWATIGLVFAPKPNRYSAPTETRFPHKRCRSAGNSARHTSTGTILES